jgi:hypothetical protein
VQITSADVENAGRGNYRGLTGTWTLTVNDDGTYMDSCQAVADPGVDCGVIPANTPMVVEAGYVRGDGQTIYFVPDVQVAARLQHCLLPVSTELYHCLRSPPYWLDWSLDGTTLTFINRGGIPPAQDSLSIKPWIKVG